MVKSKCQLIEDDIKQQVNLIFLLNSLDSKGLYDLLNNIKTEKY